MYHAMRAAAFVYHDGDDHESHSDLPLHVPPDFPNSANWQNELKNARLMRNAADYDPYPRADSFWQPRADAIKTLADDLLRATRVYLQGKGCASL